MSKETRHIEFEITGATPATGEKVIIPAYALYYVCEDVGGTCLYRRQDIRIQLNNGE